MNKSCVALKKHILHIEPRALHSDLVRQALASQKRFLLTRACDLKKALLLMKSRRFDLIVTEILENMPETILQLKKMARSTGLIVLTTKNDHNLLVELMKLGVDDYLIKNRENLSFLAQRLEKTMERRGRPSKEEEDSSMLSLLSGKIKNITDVINDPSKNWLIGKNKIHSLERELESLVGTIRNLMA